jgi:hypothetical protein
VSPAGDDAPTAPGDAAEDEAARLGFEALHAHFLASSRDFIETVRQDPGWTGDLAVFLSKTLERFDEPLRAKFPIVNSILSGAIPFPLAPVLLSMILLAVENGGLSVIEALLAERRKVVERRANPQ